MAGIRKILRVASRLFLCTTVITYVYFGLWFTHARDRKRTKLDGDIDKIIPLSDARVNENSDALIFSKEHKRKVSGLDHSHHGVGSLILPRRRHLGIDCQGVIHGDKSALDNARPYEKQHPQREHPDGRILELAGNCSNLHATGYVLQAMPDLEDSDYSVAFSILLHQDVALMERLLRAIYRPQHVFCIHVDSDASQMVQKAVKAIADCFKNVWVTVKQVNIIYAHYSRVQAELNCMQDALDHPLPWRYYINQPGSIFPLRTNAELVEILKIYNGTNDIECHRPAGGLGEFGSRVKYKHILDNFLRLRRSSHRKAPLPFGIHVVKGSAYGVFSRKFVEYILNNETAKAVLEWSKDTFSPDEHIWATLHHTGMNRMLNTPGGYTGLSCQKKPWMASYSSWCVRDVCESHKCIHGVCIPGLADLRHLVKRREFRVNKFQGNRPLVLDCLEEWLWNRTAVGVNESDLDYYRNLPFVQPRPSSFRLSLNHP